MSKKHKKEREGTRNFFVQHPDYSDPFSNVDIFSSHPYNRKKKK